MIVDKIWKLTNVVRVGAVGLAPRSSYSRRQDAFPDNVCSYSPPPLSRSRDVDFSCQQPCFTHQELGFNIGGVRLTKKKLMRDVNHVAMWYRKIQTNVSVLGVFRCNDHEVLTSAGLLFLRWML